MSLLEVEKGERFGKLVLNETVQLPWPAVPSKALATEGNRTAEQIDSGVAAATVNNLNQLTTLSSTGPIHFAGGLSEPANVTVNGVAATVDANNNFSADVPLAPGAPTVTIKATDGNGNTTTKSYQVTVTDSGVNRTLTYDANGNLTNDGNGKTYGWDAANRLVSVTQGSNVTGFVYDGLSRRVQETLNGTLIKQWVWCDGAQPCEERDGSNNVTKRFYDQGEQINGTPFFFTYDHLGSVREMTDSTGAIRARYDYDPYGRRTLVSGTDLADFGFTRFYYDQATGLWFSGSRPYDPNLARWLSRDPIGEDGGINLYQFCINNPINLIDPYGLSFQSWFAAGGAGAGFILSLPVDAIEDFFSGGTLAIANPATTTAMTGGGAVGGAALGKMIDNLISHKTGISSGRPTGSPSSDPKKDCPKKQTSPNQMQKQVERGQAPDEVDRVDKPHVPGQQPHVHYEDGTSSNMDGSTHDAGNGTPNPTQATRDWLNKNGWTPPPGK